MDHSELRRRFTNLTTPHLADACIRSGVAGRCAPPDVRSVVAGQRLIGRACVARHTGSVDVFLEAIERAEPGDVLVVDNGGRTDESCVGDLVALEARAAGLDGIVIWGLHRDTADIRAIGLPVFSMGTTPTGPQRLDPQPTDALTWARLGAWTVGGEDIVAGDEDGVIIIPAAQLGEILDAAEQIRDTERRQADRIAAGTSLRTQVRFGEYLAKRADNPELTFRAHLRAVGGAVEE